MATQIQIRRDLSSNWTSVNPTLAQGEMGLETDTNKFKFGTGTQSWTGLPYSSSGGSAGTSGTSGAAGADGDRYHTTSNTSLTIASSGTASLITNDLHLDYSISQSIIIAHDANNHMHGSVVSYNQSTGELVFDLKSKAGSGTYTSWDVNLDGAVGQAGTAGTSGVNGENGTSGLDGTSGSSGESGTSGIDGSSGTSGIDGTSGENGTSGSSGESGTSGVDGTSGANGTSGSSGESGTSGLDGTSGTSGISGSSGIDGTSGTDGFNGINGTDGSSGTSGESGTSGSSGESGTSGLDGTSGIDGTSGTSGIDGTAGTSGVSGSYTYITEDTVTHTLDLVIPEMDGAITSRVDGTSAYSSVVITENNVRVSSVDIADSPYTQINAYPTEVNLSSVDVDGNLSFISVTASGIDITSNIATTKYGFGTEGSNFISSKITDPDDATRYDEIRVEPTGFQTADAGTLIQSNDGTNGLNSSVNVSPSSISMGNTIGATSGNVQILNGIPSIIANSSIGETRISLNTDDLGAIELLAQGGIKVGYGGASNFTIPTTNGSDGQVLVAHSDGIMTWETPSSPPPTTVLATSSNADYVTMVYEDETASFIIKKSNLFAISPTQQAIIADYAGETNISLALVTKGNGALTTRLQDGSSDNGDARGIYSVDLQSQRNNAAQVASGQYSNILGGNYNRATGNWGTILGGYNTYAQGANSTAKGDDGGVTGEWSFLHGRLMWVTGPYSFSAGWANEASAYYSLSFGQSSHATHDKSFVSGQYGRSANVGEMVRSTTYMSAGADAQNSSLQLANISSLAASGTMELRAYDAAGTSFYGIQLYGSNRAVTIILNWTAVCSVSGEGTNDPLVGDMAGGQINATFKKIGGSMYLVSATTISETFDVTMNGATIDMNAGIDYIVLTFTAPSTTDNNNTYKVTATANINQVAW